MSITSVDLSQDADDLLANIVGQGPEFAFYILRNGRRIHSRWYSPDSALRFDTARCPGYYVAVGFVRSADGQVRYKRSNPVFAHPPELSGADLPALREGPFVLMGERWRFPALFYRGAPQRLFILMPSAVDRTRMRLPVFNRWTWAERGLFPGHVLCIADPTIEQHPDLRLGWLLGHHRRDATEELACIVKRIAASLGVALRDVVLWGSSAGGFAALALAACLDGATAVAINAQTDILAYEMRAQVELVRNICFDALTDDAIRMDYLGRVDMGSRWEGVENSRAILVQNIGDGHHYAMHFTPLWVKLGGRPAHGGWQSAGRHAALIFDDPAGHVAETADMAADILQQIAVRQRIDAQVG